MVCPSLGTVYALGNINQLKNRIGRCPQGLVPGESRQGGDPGFSSRKLSSVNLLLLPTMHDTHLTFDANKESTEEAAKYAIKQQAGQTSQ